MTDRHFNPFEPLGLMTGFGAYVMSYVAALLSGINNQFFQIICLIVSGLFGILASCAATYLKYRLEERKKEKLAKEIQVHQTRYTNKLWQPYTADDYWKSLTPEQRENIETLVMDYTTKSRAKVRELAEKAYMEVPKKEGEPEQQ